MADFSGKIDNYSLSIDFKNCRSVCIEQRWECDNAGEYLGGTDEDGHERKDNYAPDYDTNTVRFSYNKNTDSLVRYLGIDDETEVTTESALKEIERHLDAQRNDANRSTVIYENDGKSYSLNADRLFNMTQAVKTVDNLNRRAAAADAMSTSIMPDMSKCEFSKD